MVAAGKRMRGCTYRACTRKCCVVACCVVSWVWVSCAVAIGHRSSRRLLTHSRTPTNTNTHTRTRSHELSLPPPMLVVLLSSLGRRCRAVVWFAWHRHHAAHAELVILTDHLVLLSLFSSPLFALSGCILVDIASTGDRTTCNHTFKQPHSLLLQRQRFVASIPQFTWWYWLVVSHALVHSLHLLLCSRMNPRDVALYQSFVCLLAASTHSLSRSLSLSFHSFPSLYLALMKPVDPFYHFSLSQISSFICTYQDTLPAKLRTRDLGLV